MPDIVSTAKLHIVYIILVLLLLTSLGFGYHQYDVKNKELATLKATISIQADIAKEQAKLDAIKKMEVEEDAKLQASIKSKQDLINQIEEERKKLYTKQKEKINAEVSKMDSNTFSDMLNAMGYPSIVILK